MPNHTEIRAARPDEAAACRALLPAAFPASGWPPELFAAAAPAGLLAAAALAWTPRGFLLLLHVAEPARRQGLGRRPVAAAAASAAGETTALRPWTLLPEAGPAAAFLRAVGLQITRRLLASRPTPPPSRPR